MVNHNLISSLFLLRKHRENISRQFSYIEKINLDWLVYLTIGMTSIWSSIIFGNDISTFILVDLFILFIGYFGIKQVGIFSNQANVLSPTINGTSLEDQIAATLTSAKALEKIKYQKTSIGDELLSNLHRQLTKLIHEEKLYTDPELNLDQLAERLKGSANTLSQVINSKEERNFYDYINNLRVEEFKKLVSTLRPLSIGISKRRLAFLLENFANKRKYNWLAKHKKKRPSYLLEHQNEWELLPL